MPGGLAPIPDWLLLALVSPIVGSFLGVLAMRLPAGRPVALARSACDSCGVPLAAADLVPLLSYVALRGRCRHCRAPIGRAHPAIELGAVLVAVIVFAVLHGDSAALWSGCVLGWGALLLAWIDWRCLRLPDVITLPLLLLGLGCSWLLDRESLADHAAAAALGYLAFRLISAVYRRVRGRDGLGGGDAKLLAAGGAWLGLAELPVLVLFGALLTIAVALAGGRLDAHRPVPFGPGLAVALWLLWLLSRGGFVAP